MPVFASKKQLKLFSGGKPQKIHKIHFLFRISLFTLKPGKYDSKMHILKTSSPTPNPIYRDISLLGRIKNFFNEQKDRWGFMKVNFGNKSFKTLDELRGATLKIWTSLALQYCRKLIVSMPSRVKEVLMAEWLQPNNKFVLMKHFHEKCYKRQFSTIKQVNDILTNFRKNSPIRISRSH